MTSTPALLQLTAEQAQSFADKVRFNTEGLVAAIAQSADNKDVLMQAWMNREALLLSLTTGRAVYWSRSRNELWRKGDTSGHAQYVQDVRLDCDGDSLLLLVKQEGCACHTGAPTCFFQSPL